MNTIAQSRINAQINNVPNFAEMDKGQIHKHVRANASRIIEFPVGKTINGVRIASRRGKTSYVEAGGFSFKISYSYDFTGTRLKIKVNLVPPANEPEPTEASAENNDQAQPQPEPVLALEGSTDQVTVSLPSEQQSASAQTAVLEEASTAEPVVTEDAPVADGDMIAPSPAPVVRSKREKKQRRHSALKRAVTISLVDGKTEVQFATMSDITGRTHKIVSPTSEARIKTLINHLVAHGNTIVLPHVSEHWGYTAYIQRV